MRLGPIEELRPQPDGRVVRIVSWLPRYRCDGCGFDGPRAMGNADGDYCSAWCLTWSYVARTEGYETMGQLPWRSRPTATPLSPWTDPATGRELSR